MNTPSLDLAVSHPVTATEAEGDPLRATEAALEGEADHMIDVPMTEGRMTDTDRMGTYIEPTP